MPGPNRRDFLARTAGFLAAAAVAKLPVIDAPTPEPEPIVTTTLHGEYTHNDGDVVEFKVFGRSTMYSKPGVRR